MILDSLTKTSHRNRGFLDVGGYITACHLVARFSINDMPKELPADLQPQFSRSCIGECTCENAIVSTTVSSVSQDLPDLSDEIWIMIFKNLTKSALREACKVSRHFHNIGIPMLYEVVNLISMCVPSQTSSYPHIWVQQYRFLKQILKRPDYALFVREFRWTSKSPLLLSKSDHDMLFRELKLVFSTHELLDRIY